jgi:hypothetical protein
MRYQEIFYALWDGTRWSAPVRLTNNQRPDGMPAVAGDASGATLAWIQDGDGDAATRQDWKIAVTHWSLSTGAWTTVQLLTYRPDVMNAQVAVARRSGQAALAWTVDEDGNVATSTDRYIVLAQCPSPCTGIRYNALPLGADSPSGALTPSGGALAFLVRRDPQGRELAAGLGNAATVWVAHYITGSSGLTWEVTPIRDSSGNAVRGEDPVVRRAGATGELLVAFRRFGKAGTTAALGQVALSRIEPGHGVTPPVYLASDATQKWQLAMEVDSATNEAVVLSVARGGRPGRQEMAHGRQPCPWRRMRRPLRRSP